jgi:hypothetical protein
MSIGKKVLLVGASLFVALVIVGVAHQTTPEGKAATAVREKEESAERTQRQEDTVKRQQEEFAQLKKNAVSAATLQAAYEQNEVSADNEYKGKVVVVHGRVGTIAKDIIDTSYVILDAGESSIGSIQCFFDDSSNARLAKLSPGQSVYIKGTVNGKMMNVLLKDCIILE